LLNTRKIYEILSSLLILIRIDS